MQKVQSYLYPNRVILIADLAGFNVENTIVYAKTVKIYNGIDNTIQFDIQNADQKRLDLTQYNSLEMNVMDINSNPLSNSPYQLSLTATKGLATVKIPQEDLDELTDQYLTYSITATDSSGNDFILYTDSRFSAVGSIQLIGNAMPKFRDDVVYDRFQGEINFMGNVINHTSAIPCKFYEAEATNVMDTVIDMTDFIGTIYVEATKDSTISVESFRDADQLASITYSTKTTTTLPLSNLTVTGYNYIRVSWVYPNISPYNFTNTNPYGTVDKVTVSY
jgi:hypothetical protein